MCGIIGQFNRGTSVQPLSLDSIRHRGPDSEGSWLSDDQQCWLGHTRLAIQDLSHAGFQPITSQCNRYTLVFNGEIYNHLQIRRALRISTWRGSCDSETLVEGLAQRGPSIVLELRGMFAFAAYDSQKKQLLLARDRLGIKPLYVEIKHGSINFASEKRALKGGKQISDQTITQVLVFGHDNTVVPDNMDEVDGVFSMPPGVLIRIPISSPSVFIKYWPPQPRPDWTPLPITDRTWCKEFLRRQLLEVMRQHLIADVDIAFFLSSGIDSGILLSLACREMANKISSFTVSLPGSPEDEARSAFQMAHYCGSDHHELYIDSNNALSWVEEALTILDTPSVDAINTYMVSKAVASQGIKVAISGLGADELFGGYPAHRIIPWVHMLGIFPVQIRRWLISLIIPAYSYKFTDLNAWDTWHTSLCVRRWRNDDMLRLAGAMPLRWPECPTNRILQDWGQISWAELFGYTEPMLLRDSDNMSMASGLELRVPYLDHEFVEAVLRIPRKFHGKGKTLLKESFSDLFPQGYLNHKKTGFGLPMRDWMLGPLDQLCLMRIESLKQKNWLNEDWIRLEWDGFVKGQYSWNRAWSLVVLGEFARRDAVQ